MAFENLDLEKMAGQRLMVGFDGTHLNSQLRQYIKDYKVGGLILFSRNLETPDQIKQLCAQSQAFAAECGLPPLIISVDQEGGVVARLKAPFTQFPGNPSIQSISDARKFSIVTARELLGAGFTLDLAPVMDVAPVDLDSVMKDRVFPGGPDRVAELGCAVIEELQNQGVPAVAKHFPGIGRTTLDSHIDLPFCHTSREQLEAEDFPPFAAAIASRVSGIMLSHIVYTALDPDWPASISQGVVSLLRDTMGYSGVIMTDDLDMGAIAKKYDIVAAMERVLVAGVDMVLICHPGPSIGQAFDVIRRGLMGDMALREKGKESVRRILDLKAAYPV